MPQVTATVIERLAAGRLSLSQAVESLRARIEGGVSLHTVTQAVRAEAGMYGLEPSLMQELLDALTNATRLHAAPEAAPAPTAIRAAATIARPSDATPRGNEPEPALGSLLKGRFELKTLVGRGGMGTVFSALDRRKAEAHDPNPDVAVKILNPGFQRHPDAFVALQREASKAQTLAHPNIVTVFDFDRDGASVFITMELLRGQPLEATIRAARNRGVGRDTALPIIRGITEGLAYAHRKRIVHSDLKPANIFLLDDGTPKILDFGIARALPAAGDSGPQDQFDAGSLGAYTEAYATEEMVKGADPALTDDIYALGIIVYELLSGKHPFSEKTAAAARAAEMTPAPIRGLRRREWRTLARALAFDRATRPRDATEFLRLFFGSAQLRNSLLAATILLAAATAYLWYRNYEQTGPQIAFDALPVATQQQIQADFAEGAKAWVFYAQQGIPNALTDSLSFYADAYKLHKGNRDAVRGLERAADEMLKRAGKDSAALRETARNLAETSEFLRTYPPVTAAISR